MWKKSALGRFREKFCGGGKSFSREKSKNNCENTLMTNSGEVHRKKMEIVKNTQNFEMEKIGWKEIHTCLSTSTIAENPVIASYTPSYPHYPQKYEGFIQIYIKWN